MDDHVGSWRIMVRYGEVWRTMVNHGEPWQAMENHGNAMFLTNLVCFYVRSPAQVQGLDRLDHMAAVLLDHGPVEHRRWRRHIVEGLAHEPGPQMGCCFFAGL